MTSREDVTLARRSLKWPVPDRLRQAAVEMLWDAIENPDVHVRTRIEAARTALQMDALNLQISMAENETRPAANAPAVIYILPPNGSEAPEPPHDAPPLIEAEGVVPPTDGGLGDTPADL